MSSDVGPPEVSLTAPTDVWAEELAAYERDVLEPEAEFLRSEDAKHQQQKRKNSEGSASTFGLPLDLAPLLRIAIYSPSMRARIKAADMLVAKIGSAA